MLPEAKIAWFLLFRELYTSDSLPGNELTGHFPSLVHSIDHVCACVVWVHARIIGLHHIYFIPCTLRAFSSVGRGRHATLMCSWRS